MPELKLKTHICVIAWLLSAQVTQGPSLAGVLHLEYCLLEYCLQLYRHIWASHNKPSRGKALLQLLLSLECPGCHPIFLLGTYMPLSGHATVVQARILTILPLNQLLLALVEMMHHHPMPFNSSIDGMFKIPTMVLVLERTLYSNIAALCPT